MAKEVTCHITGEKGPREEFVKIGRYYYKSQEIYDEMVENRDKINEAKGIIAKDFLGYAKGQKYPTFVDKKMKELDYYCGEVILRTVKEQYDTIAYYMRTKEFSSDFAKASYIFAIITNTINEVDKKYKKEQKEMKAAEKKQEELDCMVSLLNTSCEKAPKQRNKDISGFIGG